MNRHPFAERMGRLVQEAPGVRDRTRAPIRQDVHERFLRVLARAEAALVEAERRSGPILPPTGRWVAPLPGAE